MFPSTQLSTKQSVGCYHMYTVFREVYRPSDLGMTGGRAGGPSRVRSLQP